MFSRFVLGLLLGVIVGGGGAAYFFSSGGGDYLIATSEKVRRLEEDLRKSERESEFLARKLDEVADLAEKFEGKFEKLETTFTDLTARLERILAEHQARHGEARPGG